MNMFLYDVVLSILLLMFLQRDANLDREGQSRTQQSSSEELNTTETPVEPPSLKKRSSALPDLLRQTFPSTTKAPFVCALSMPEEEVKQYWMLSLYI